MHREPSGCFRAWPGSQRGEGPGDGHIGWRLEAVIHQELGSPPEIECPEGGSWAGLSWAALTQADVWTRRFPKHCVTMTSLCSRGSVVPMILKKIIVFICLFLAVPLGLHCFTGFFTSCGERGLLSACAELASHCSGFSGCRPQAPGHEGSAAVVLGSRAQAQKLWLTTLVAPRHRGSSQTSD